MEETAESIRMRDNEMARCKKSCAYWILTYAWTYKQREINSAGRTKNRRIPHHPFVLWPVQVDAVEQLMASVLENEEDMLMDKSRDMGATWLACAVIAWLFLFHGDMHILCMSRKEDLVDNKGDINTIFGKIDYMLNNLPDWMKPKITRTKMFIQNKKTRATIAGESTNESAGRSQRYALVFLDEFAEVEASGTDAATLFASLSDTTSVRWVNSTPKGPGTEFTRLRLSGKIRVISLGWWNHPEKGRDRALEFDEHGRKIWTSPFYRFERSRRDRRDVAINLDMDHLGAGASFFDHEIINIRLATAKGMVPRRGVIRWDDQIPWETADEMVRKRLGAAVCWDEDGGRREWSVWCDLTPDRQTGILRPPQNKAYVIGADLGHGQGMANTVFSVATTEGDKVAEFVSAEIQPYEAARLFIAAALWFGGVTKNPFLIWEADGPGQQFGAEVMRLRYPRVYFRRVAGTKRAKATDHYGWKTTRGNKEILLGDLRKAYARDEFRNPSEAALEEAMSYVYTDTGAIEAGLTGKADDSGAKAPHGDRVIADAMVWQGVMEHPKVMKQEAEYLHPTSIGARIKTRRQTRHAGGQAINWLR